MNTLQLVAEQVGVSERTLRRALGEGTLHAVRPTPRTLEMSVSERDYARRKWPLLSELRAQLRTESNVRLALLFGSTAADRDTPGSDVDLLVHLRDPSFGRLLDLRAKLEAGVGRASTWSSCATPKLIQPFWLGSLRRQECSSIERSAGHNCGVVRSN
jgi:predicted nucleotidyltransferase